MATIARELRQEVFQSLALPTCVGIAPTKTLAKLANHVAKSAERKPGSYPAQLAQVCHFGEMSEKQLRWLFKRTEIGDVWGIGRRIASKLNDAGIHTVLDLVDADEKAAKAVQRGAGEDGPRVARHALPGAG